MLSNKVSEIMTGEVITASASAPIFDVMEMMAAKDVGGVVITDQQTPVGIFTEQDVLRRVMHKKLDVKKTSIKRVMTSPIRAVRAETHIIEALGKMYKSKFRHLLVRGETRAIIGMVSMRDILKLVVELGHDLPETQTIGGIMSGGLITVDGAQSIHETTEVMVKKSAVCVIVQTQQPLKGIFTERDLLKRVAVKNIDPERTPIREVMTPDFVAMAHSALVGEVLGEMYRGEFRNMPIRGDHGELIGIVSLSDVLKYAKALDVDENVRRTWKEIEEFWESEEQYTPG